MVSKSDPFEKLKPLVVSKGKEQDVRKFHKTVNEVFHNVEANFYDQNHQNMWESLPTIFDKLSQTVLEKGFFSQEKNLRLLDIGSGTGLSSDLFLKTRLGQRVTEVTLLDSSTEMISKSKLRSQNWPDVKAVFVNDYVEAVEGQFDIILCSSLLHHIPDLPAFFASISRLQAKGAVFLHLQDPNSYSLTCKHYQERQNRYKQLRIREKMIANLNIFNLIELVSNRVKIALFGSDLFNEVNKQLHSKGIIRQSLTEDELWSVTDIHVENLPYSIGKGISLEMMEEHLLSYNKILCFTYAFFGPLAYELPKKLQEEEKSLLQKQDMSGRNLAGIWVKNED